MLQYIKHDHRIKSAILKGEVLGSNINNRNIKSFFPAFLYPLFGDINTRSRNSFLQKRTKEEPIATSDIQRIGPLLDHLKRLGVPKDKGLTALSPPLVFKFF